MIIGIDCGHSLKNSLDYGASGIKEESNLTREVGNKVIELFTNKGHQVVNCTVDYCDSLNDSLYKRYNKANMNHCDYFISIHFNAFNGSAHGTEILYHSETDEKMERILSNFVSLGFTNRGLKQRTNLAVLKNTNMKAMLIECCFCDSAEDMNIYNVDSFSKAIVEGFLGENLSVGQTINVTSKPYIPISMSSKSGGSVSPTSGVSGTMGTVTASTLNVRNTPSGTIIGQLSNGTKVKIDRIEGDWISIFFGDNGGWISKNYVSIGANIIQKPTPQSDTWVADLQNECNRQGYSNQAVDNIAGKITLASVPTLKKGSKGGITKLLQIRLNSLGFDCGIDGIFGNLTFEAVMSMQNYYEIDADGICGKQSWSKLLGL